MKVRVYSALGGAVAMIAFTASEAGAAFVGVSIHNENSAILNHANANVKNSYIAAGGPAAWTVYRVYANFDALGGNNRVNGVFGAPDGRPFQLNAFNDSFFNVVDGEPHGGPDIHYDLPPFSSLFNVHRQLGWETYMGPGFVQNAGSILVASPGSFDGPLGANHLLGDVNATEFSVSMDLNASAGFASATIPPGGSPLARGAAGRVFLMQLTVAMGTEIEGVVGLSIGGPGNVVEFWNNDLLSPQTTRFQTYLPPAPGALSLLVLAGLAGSRRRRL